MKYKAVSITKLIEQKNRGIYCFGAGRAFENFMAQSPQFKLENHIKAIVDNHPERIGASMKSVRTVEIPIISLEQMLADIEDQDCILITTAAYEEIINQLEMIDQLHSIECYVYWLTILEQFDYDRRNVKLPSKISLYQGIQIPKTIHYCWFGKQKIPDQYRKWMESWKQYCPDYEIIEWNEDNYDVYKNRYISQAYEMKKWAFVSDYARIDIVNQYGGVYLDTDVELVKNLDELLKNDAFCGFESYEYVAYGLGFGSKKNNGILQEIKEYYDNTRFVLEDGSLNQINCPVIQTDVMKKHGLKRNGEFQIVDGMTVFPSRVLCGMSPHSFRIECDPIYTYAIHHFSASWIEGSTSKDEIVKKMKKYSKYQYNEL